MQGISFEDFEKQNFSGLYSAGFAGAKQMDQSLRYVDGTYEKCHQRGRYIGCVFLFFTLSCTVLTIWPGFARERVHALGINDQVVEVVIGAFGAVALLALCYGFVGPAQRCIDPCCCDSCLPSSGIVGGFVNIAPSGRQLPQPHTAPLAIQDV
mmetsp:Transcript_66267/g.167950  ORF Transcript_66267/g.167950 Transcript_66267/m.167950 type:complete len:153 (-) Transcript_66267:145-603(-)